MEKLVLDTLSTCHYQLGILYTKLSGDKLTDADKQRINNEINDYSKLINHLKKVP